MAPSNCYTNLKILIWLVAKMQSFDKFPFKMQVERTGHFFKMKYSKLKWKITPLEIQCSPIQS